MSSNSTPPAATASTPWFPILIVAFGYYLRRVHGSDGILGILCGLALIAQVVVTARRSADSLSPVGRFVVRWSRILIALGVLAVAVGALDAAGVW